MIIDKLVNLHCYRGLSANLDTAIDFLTTHELAVLPSGRTVVDGDNVFINHFGYETAEQSCDFENHRHYIDLHIPLSGNEQVALVDAADLTTVSYDSENDGEVLAGDERYRVPLCQGDFIILMPGEAHIPKLLYGKANLVDKLVCKVLVR